MIIDNTLQNVPPHELPACQAKVYKVKTAFLSRIETGQRSVINNWLP
jgi:hypothetical protein